MTVGFLSDILSGINQNLIAKSSLSVSEESFFYLKVICQKANKY